MKIRVERSSTFREESLKQLYRAGMGAIMLVYGHNDGIHTLVAIKTGGSWYAPSVERFYTSEHLWQMFSDFHILHHHY